MTILELVNVALQKNAEAFGNIHENRLEKIVQTVLNELGKQIRTTQEGEIEVESFGKFIVRQVRVKKDEQEITQRRIVFRDFGFGKKVAKKGKQDL
jgi:hypothetical protein